MNYNTNVKVGICSQKFLINLISNNFLKERNFIFVTMEVNKYKTKIVRNLGNVDISRLKHKIDQLKESDWDTEEDYKANYNKERTALLGTKHLIFKFSNKQVTPYEYTEYSRWMDWKEELLPLMDAATKPYNYDHGVYTRVMLANLPSKAFIRMHTDGDEAGTKPHKIHIPIQTNDSVYFFIEEERFHFEEGSAYEVNNSAKHAVANGGETDRIHLIFEYLDFNAQTKEIQQQIEMGEKRDV